MSELLSILDEKPSTVHAVRPHVTVLAAVEKMCHHHIGALLVRDDDDAILGIVSERDVMKRVVLRRLDASVTPVAAIMTVDVAYVDLDAPPEEAMAIMTQRRCRHLPVFSAGRLVGIVSIGDLVRWGSRTQAYEIQSLRDYVTGAYPG